MRQDQNSYDKYNFPGESGYYAVQLAGNKTRQRQGELLATAGESYQPAPVAVAALTLLLHLKETGTDLLRGNWCRCKEETEFGFRLNLGVFEGRVSIFIDWASDCIGGPLRLAAARKA